MGRPKGSKNKNPYPWSEERQRHMEHLASASDIVAKRMKTWANKSDEELLDIQKRRGATRAKFDLNAKIPTADELHRVNMSMSKAFGVPPMSPEEFTNG